MAQKLAEQLDLKVRAYIARSLYTPTFNDHDGKDDAVYHTQFVDLPDSGGGTHILAPSNVVIWNRQGAFNEPISGATPLGLSTNGAGGMFIFEKGKAPRQE